MTNRLLSIFALTLVVGLVAAGSASSQTEATPSSTWKTSAIIDNPQHTRIKDLAKIEGAGTGMSLIGFGLVVGLAGTGDQQGTDFTVRALVNMLTKMGITVDAKDVRVNNVAAVMVTTELPPFARPGTRLDVTVSTIGDCKSLEGGTLLYTPLKSSDEEIYASAQGALSIGGYNIQGGGGGARIKKNHSTTGRIPGGSTVERELASALGDEGIIRLALTRPDFTTATRIAEAVDKRFGEAGLAKAVNPNSVEVSLGKRTGIFRSMVELISELEQISVQDDDVFKVVINERTGTVVAGAEVRVKKVAISHSSLMIAVRPQTLLEEIGAMGSSSNATSVREEKSRVHLVGEETTVGELVDALNRGLGITSRDTIAILQALKVAGALNAELVIM